MLPDREIQTPEPIGLSHEAERGFPDPARDECAFVLLMW